MTSIEQLISKYIKGAENAIKQIGEINNHRNLNNKKVKTVFDWAKNYLQDAKYYRDKGNLETSLTSVAYCEGLLDALRLLDAVDFSW